MPNDLQSIVTAAKQDAVARGAPAQAITVQSAQRVTGETVRSAVPNRRCNTRRRWFRDGASSCVWGRDLRLPRPPWPFDSVSARAGDRPDRGRVGLKPKTNPEGYPGRASMSALLVRAC